MNKTDRSPHALALTIEGLGKSFGTVRAIDQISFTIQPGSMHALLGGNGAGKSTVVKCLAGFQSADQGRILINGRAERITSPTAARQLAIGMVYQHFTSAPGMTVAENILLANDALPACIDWKTTRKQLQAFLDSTPFQLDLDAFPSALSAGEKQKLELLKQLYLKPGLLILDEPTSVLTPQEADDILGHVRDIAAAGHCSVLLITHKFQEVTAYCQQVTVLHQGKVNHDGAVASSSTGELAAKIVGGAAPASDDIIAAACQAAGRPPGSKTALTIRDLSAYGDRGALALQDIALTLHAGEILGVAGVAGNGQRELLECITGLRRRESGTVTVNGQPYTGTRKQNRLLKVRCLPEEPLHNACISSMTVAENMTLRDFDAAPYQRHGVLHFGQWRQRARRWISQYRIKTHDEQSAIGSLSGGNIQRAVLARELDGQPAVLIAANPVFGLDFAAVDEIHDKLRQLRTQGTAILLISEDVDELLALADRIIVFSSGRIIFETSSAQTDRRELGRYMGGAQK